MRDFVKRRVEMFEEEIPIEKIYATKIVDTI